MTATATAWSRFTPAPGPSPTPLVRRSSTAIRVTALGLNFESKSTTASRFSDHSSFWDKDYASFLIIENFFDDTIVRDRNP